MNELTRGGNLYKNAPDSLIIESSNKNIIPSSSTSEFIPDISPSAISMAAQATLTVAGKAIGSTGYGLMSINPTTSKNTLLDMIYEKNLTDTTIGLTANPSNPITYPEAAKVMKAALEQGANFWNGVRNTLFSTDSDI